MSLQYALITEHDEVQTVADNADVCLHIPVLSLFAPTGPFASWSKSASRSEKAVNPYSDRLGIVVDFGMP